MKKGLKKRKKKKELKLSLLKRRVIKIIIKDIYNGIKTL